MSLWPVNRDPWLSGTVRFRITRWRRRAILQVEELFYCVSIHTAPRPDSSHLVIGYHWRDARPEELRDPSLNRIFVLGDAPAPRLDRRQPAERAA